MMSDLILALLKLVYFFTPTPGAVSVLLWAHLTGEEATAPRPRAHSRGGAEPGFEPRPSGPRVSAPVLYLASCRVL